MDKNVVSESVLENNKLRDVFQEIEMIYPLEYYKNEITKYESAYYGFNNTSMKITDLMNISSIVKVDKTIPGLLTFLVCWLNQKGYVYWFYGFNNDQKIVEHYYCGDFVSFKDYRKLMEKLYGNVAEYATISINDFNKNGRNEIALYSFYKNIGNVFWVHEFNDVENKLQELCLVPVFINYDNPFPSVEYTGNGFRILEIMDENPMELQWINYTWEEETGKYIKE